MSNGKGKKCGTTKDGKQKYLYSKSLPDGRTIKQCRVPKEKPTSKGLYGVPGETRKTKEGVEFIFVKGKGWVRN